MIKPNIFQTTTSIWSAISLKKDNCGRILQFKQGSYNLPVIDEKKTKRNISELIKSLRAEYTVRDISILLGISSGLKLLIVCHSYQENGMVIRIISARKANKNEQKQYGSFLL